MYVVPVGPNRSTPLGGRTYPPHHFIPTTPHIDFENVSFFVLNLIDMDTKSLICAKPSDRSRTPSVCSYTMQHIDMSIEGLCHPEASTMPHICMLAYIQIYGAILTEKCGYESGDLHSGEWVPVNSNPFKII